MLKIINKYTKTGNLKYISHLDVLRFIQRAVKRAGIPAKYSEGFNPHMKTSFGFPLSLGNESIGEYFELELNEKIDINDYISRLNSVMPKEMQILAAGYSDNEDSIMSRTNYTEYLIYLESEDMGIDNLNALFQEMLETGIIYKREKKNKKNKKVIKEINTKDLISYVKANKNSDRMITVEVVFIAKETGSMKTEEFIRLIEERGFNIKYYSVMKIDSLDKNMKPIMEQ